jgi:hypothetical protein
MREKKDYRQSGRERERERERTYPFTNKGTGENEGDIHRVSAR